MCVEEKEDLRRRYSYYNSWLKHFGEGGEKDEERLELQRVYYLLENLSADFALE